MNESLQKTLSHVRPPRVHITYDVEIGDSTVMKELPFCVGVIADLAGTGGGKTPQKRLRDRAFIDIDRDNFDDVLKSIHPHITCVLPNYLGTRHKNFTLDMTFECMEDFSPLHIVQKHPMLQFIYAERTHLKDIQTKTDSNDTLDDMLMHLLQDEAQQKGLIAEINGFVAHVKKTLGLSKKSGDEKAGSEKTGEKSSPSQLMPDALSVLSAHPLLDTTGMKPTPIIDTFIEDGRLVWDGMQKHYATALLWSFLDVCAKSPDLKSAGLHGFLALTIQSMDCRLHAQLNAILHEPAFQSLEGSWRGLHHLVMRTRTGPSLKLRVLHAPKHELIEDFKNASEFDQSLLFKKVYEEEYGTFGGTPYSCLVGDYTFGRHPEDLELLQNLSKIAAASHAPFLSASDPKLFDMTSFEQISLPRDLSKIFESQELAKWQSFRASEDSRYVCMTLPRTLIRMPYGARSQSTAGLAFEEDVFGEDQEQYFCWTNTAYILAERITHAFEQHGWTAAIRGVEGGGVVDNLPTYTFKTTDGDVSLRCPTEMAITDRREKELAHLGFIPLSHCKGTDYAAFFSTQTCQKPLTYSTEHAQANAHLSSRLTYILAASRFAHYIKVIMRDKMGSFMNRERVEKYLNSWLANYVLLNDDASQDVKARYPLREGRIDVFEDTSNPGAYTAVVYLRPHFQLEELGVSLRLVASLPNPITQS